MIVDRNIPIRNIYYMLTYAFKELKRNNYEHIAGEHFDNIFDLFAEIISRGVAYLLKQGIHKDYAVKADIIPSLKGKLDLQGTIRERVSQRTRLACEYDELTINNIFNGIIRTTVGVLLGQADVKAERRNRLKKLMMFFEGVGCVKPSQVDWSMLRYDRNTRTYQMLHSLCFLILQNQLLTTEEGEVKLLQFSDSHLNMLFQRFVMEYYKRHHPEYKALAKQIAWNFSSTDAASSRVLPLMQTDITLRLGERTLIIDTKYYSHNMQEHYGDLKVHSPNFYQIHSYVMNEDKGHKGLVDGMLLYARTADALQPEGNFKTHEGNNLMVRTLDLSQDFEGIKQGLENLVDYDI